MKDPLISIYDLSTKTTQYFEFLLGYKYNILEINFKNLDGFNEDWTQRPFVETVYANGKNRKISVRLYDNGIVFVRIRNFVDKKEFSFDDYIMHKNNTKIQMMYAERKREESYVDYYVNLTKASFESDIKDVILGEKWIDVPFDWQGYK